MPEAGFGAMQRHGCSLFCWTLALAFELGGFGLLAAENDPRVLATSPSGQLRVEQRGEQYWIANTKEPVREDQLAVETPEAAPVEFHFSPNEEWLFTLPDGGSCRREGSLFHRDATSGRMEEVKSFREEAWRQSAKLKAFTTDFAAAEACRMMRFMGWSLDSSRLLLALRGGQGKTEMEGAYLYFHTGTKRFELTAYLRRVNQLSSDILLEPVPCTEPAGPLPPVAELKARLEKLDAELNAKYAGQIKSTPENQVGFLRSEQREWIKRRDAGLKLYLSFAKGAEKEMRRLQYLGDITTLRLERSPGQWHMVEDWLF